MYYLLLAVILISAAVFLIVRRGPGRAHKRPVRAAGKRVPANTVFSARPERAIICPRCGTAQSREQDSCRSCGVGFIFLSETNRFG
ncbi:hypothetical protein SAMN02745823_03788 [Sporobacter termitidis DSM 10068]|uniref:Uncharacterized protein n=1 Tax=Sporobacter termitidis DSM 10068 TaxID=1123282 RepID=A0A1M5ZIF1_9FIRM|nr:hypothetical protein [Sporobacter termitidis]SHI23938.1 hypothetical protein SAMN02745823_03788 [Sporobacter termitidis DSM 10068]